MKTFQIDDVSKIGIISFNFVYYITSSSPTGFMIDYGVLAFFEENFGQITQKISQKLIYYYSTQSLAHSNLKCQKSGNRSKNYYTWKKKSLIWISKDILNDWVEFLFLYIFYISVFVDICCMPTPLIILFAYSVGFYFFASLWTTI